MLLRRQVLHGTLGIALVALLVPGGSGLAAQEPDAGPELAGPGAFGGPGEEVELGWRGSADLGLTLTRGNSETSNLSLAARTVWQGRRQKWIFAGSHLRASTDGEETANRGELLVQYDYFPGDRFFFFGKAGASFNEPAGLDLRLSPGLGAGYLLVRSGSLELAAEGGATWIRDKFRDGSSDEAVYLALGETLTWTVSETTELTEALTYNPRSTELDDYLLRGEASLATRIVGGLGLKLSVVDEFDSRPFVDPTTGEQLEKNDLTFVTGLTYEF